jgi:hypothetical protein
MAKKAAKKKKTTRKKKSSEPSAKEQWEALKEEVGIDEVESYVMSGTYSPNSAIQHPKFGLGIVIQSVSHKIEVVFEDGTRNLVHNR